MRVVSWGMDVGVGTKDHNTQLTEGGPLEGGPARRKVFQEAEDNRGDCSCFQPTIEVEQ